MPSRNGQWNGQMRTADSTIALGIFFLCSVCCFAAPDQPLGIKGEIDSLHKACTLTWEPVRQTAAGAPLTNLAGYNIYRRVSVRGTAERINSYIVPVSIFADRVNGQTFYYSVRAVDADGVESAESLLVDSSDNTNLIFLAGDGRTSIVIPQTISGLLQSSNNKYGVPLTIRLKENFAATSGVVRDLEFQFLRGDTKQVATDIAFSAPDADVQIGYELLNGEVPLQNNLSVSPDQLTLYWSNGINWIKVGGANDKSGQIVSINSSQLGHYQLRDDSPSSELTLSKITVYPSLLTPNGDGFNDRVYMVFENPGNASLHGDIYDLFGRHVASLAPPASMGGETTLVWNGKTNDGTTIPSGLYVYRIEGDIKTITGTIAVAR